LGKPETTYHQKRSLPTIIRFLYILGRLLNFVQPHGKLSLSYMSEC